MFIRGAMKGLWKRSTFAAALAVVAACGSDDDDRDAGAPGGGTTGGSDQQGGHDGNGSASGASTGGGPANGTTSGVGTDGGASTEGGMGMDTDASQAIPDSGPAGAVCSDLAACCTQLSADNKTTCELAVTQSQGSGPACAFALSTLRANGHCN